MNDCLMTFKIRCEFNKSEYEYLWFILRPKWLPRLISKLALACVYLPPSLNTKVVEGFYEYFCYCYDTLITESPNTSIIASGDFNPINNEFKERVIINHCQLKQMVKKPTRGTAILDLILTNAHPFYVKPKVLGPIGCSDHCIIEWKSKEQLHDKNKTLKIKARPIKESSVRLFDDYISLQKWSAVNNAPCVKIKGKFFCG